MENEFKRAWEKLESTRERPTRYRRHYEIEWSDFKKRVESQDPGWVKEFTDAIFSGDAFLLKRAFTKEYMKDVQKKTAALWKQSPSSFHKMLEGTPDFHRMIDEELAKNYSFKMSKHSYYFYRWNSDPLGLYPPTDERWRVIKKAMGLDPRAYESNTPKDGVIDRIQIVRYPPKIGGLETHSDPFRYQRLIISGYMSKRGIDFETGGFYFIDSNNQKVDFEDFIDIGDITIAYATVLHGVDLVDTHKPLDWSKEDGRWFYSLYSNQSDEVKDRHTGYAVKV